MYDYNPEWMSRAGNQLYAYIMAKTVHGVQGRNDLGRPGWMLRECTLQQLVCGAIWMSEVLSPEAPLAPEHGSGDQWVPAVFPNTAYTQTIPALFPFVTHSMAMNNSRAKFAHCSRASPWVFPTPTALLGLPQKKLSRVPLGGLRPERFQKMDKPLISEPPHPGSLSKPCVCN